MLRFTKSGNSVERVIRKYYLDYGSLPVRDQKLLINYCIQYLFKAISASKFTSLVRETIGNKDFRVIELRRTLLLSKGYFLKNLKLWLYFWYKEKPHVTKMVLKSYGVKSMDADIHKVLDDASKKMLADMVKKGYKNKTLLEFDSALAYVAMHKDYVAFVRKFVYRKMRFIYEMHGQDPDDICKELTADSLQAAMFMYPRIESMEHLMNIVKRTAHNSGINYIEKYTTKGRGRLRSGAKPNEDSRVVIPMSSPEAKDFLATDENGTHIDGKSYDSFTTRISVERVTSKYSGKKRHFIKLLSGEFDKEFSEYLKARKVRYENDDYFGRVDFKTYMQTALAFLEVPEESGIKFVNKLRSKLSSMKNVA